MNEPEETQRLSNRSAAVDRFMEALDHPMKETVNRIRVALLASNPAITEQIKWNAPSFGYQGNDRVIFKLYPPQRIQLVFHRGAKKVSTDFSFHDPSGLLVWAALGRAIVMYADEEVAQANLSALLETVNAWIEATSSEEERLRRRAERML